MSEGEEKKKNKEERGIVGNKVVGCMNLIREEQYIWFDFCVIQDIILVYILIPPGTVLYQ